MSQPLLSSQQVAVVREAVQSGAATIKEMARWRGCSEGPLWTLTKGMHPTRQLTGRRSVHPGQRYRKFFKTYRRGEQ